MEVAGRLQVSVNQEKGKRSTWETTSKTKESWQRCEKTTDAGWSVKAEGQRSGQTRKRTNSAKYQGLWIVGHQTEGRRIAQENPC